MMVVKWACRRDGLPALVLAQQILSADVQADLDILQSSWMSVASVADLRQTDGLCTRRAAGTHLDGWPDCCSN